jgi:hypothetical protein
MLSVRLPENLDRWGIWYGFVDSELQPSIRTERIHLKLKIAFPVEPS